MAEKNSDLGLPIRKSANVIQGAVRQIKSSMEGDHRRLKSRWGKLNKLMMGGFYFGTNVIVPGLSGHGKSYFLNMLHQDFLNKNLNGNLTFKFRILHFGFEMQSEKEALRSIASSMNMTYQDLISAYEPLTSADYEKIVQRAKNMVNDYIFYVEKPGNIYQVYKTIEKFRNRFPDEEIVVTMDHSLLLEYLDEKSEVELMSKWAREMIEIKKTFNCLTIVLSQMNSEIEKPERRGDPRFHFPIKSDIFSSKQIYHAADVIMVLHRPEMLQIDYYGPKKIPTKDLVMLHVIKNRDFDPGYVRLRNNLSTGRFEDYDSGDLKLPYNLK